MHFIIISVFLIDASKIKVCQVFWLIKVSSLSSRMLKSVGGGLVTSLGYYQLGKKKALLRFCSREFYDSPINHTYMI